jgi:HlyD family secretion protein
MIKNSLLAGGLIVALVTSCEAKDIGPEPFQGVVELDERVLAFEVGGRVNALDVKRGDIVKKGARVSKLNAELGDTVREARRAEADAARSQVALLKAGTRSEELRSMEAQIRSVKATEALIEKNLSKERELVKRGVSTPSMVDDLETRLATTVAQRQSLEQQLKGLKRGARKQEIQSAESQAEAADKGVAVESEKIEKYQLESPIEGNVLDVHVEPGEVVAAGAPVVTIGDTTHPYVDVFVPVGKLEGIRVGTPASVRVDQSPQPFSAKVEHVARATEFTPKYLFSKRERPSLVIRVRLRVDDPEERLHAGTPAFASFDGQPVNPP